MARRRFFVDRVRNGRAELAGDDAHHLTRVLRVEAGQKFEISDNSRVWLAEVETARKNLVTFAVLEEIEPAPEVAAITLWLALIKFERLEWAIEKATELGVSKVLPVETSRSEQGLFQGALKRVERWRRIAREASEQSRRLRVPEIADPAKLDTALLDASTRRILLDEAPGAPPFLKAVRISPRDSVSLLIGPEGGWIDEERRCLHEAGWMAVSLGPFILRAETAVCAALALVTQMFLAAQQNETGISGGTARIEV
jgi:16S rRNA (uracil1498-N3)-methyltransferase